jgi:hypothetical protein
VTWTENNPKNTRAETNQALAKLTESGKQNKTGNKQE